VLYGAGSVRSLDSGEASRARSRVPQNTGKVTFAIVAYRRFGDT
jgi:hypothetical protein